MSLLITSCTAKSLFGVIKEGGDGHAVLSHENKREVEHR